MSIKHRIGTVAKLTGISAHALRVWERRYGALSQHRTPGGARLYDEADVRRLRLVQLLLERGHAIGDIVTLSERQLRALSGANDAPRELAHARSELEIFLQAAEHIDVETAEQVLRRARAAMAPLDFALSVAAPLLESVGQRWSRGTLCVAGEHAASVLLRRSLEALIQEHRPPPEAPRMVVATPAGERHELGALLVGVVATVCGFRVVHLGADLSAADIAQAVRRAQGAVLALSVVSMEPARAREEIERVAEDLPASVPIFVGGRVGAALDLPLAQLTVLPDLHALGVRLRHVLGGLTTPAPRRSGRAAKHRAAPARA